MNEFKTGDKVYSLEGHAGEYVTSTPKGHLVQFYYEGSYGDETYTELGNPTLVDKVFHNAPVEKLDAKIVDLSARVKELTGKKYALHNEITAMEKEVINRKKEYAKYDGLSILHDFMDKKIEYVVVGNSYDLSIQTFQNAFDVKDKYDSGLKLVSLFGRSNGDFTYKVNAYKDGSGYDTTIWPCRTYEDAISYVTEKVKENLADQHVKINTYILAHIITLIKKYNLDIKIPKEILDKYIAQKSEEMDDAIARQQKDVDRLALQKDEFLKECAIHE